MSKLSNVFVACYYLCSWFIQLDYRKVALWLVGCLFSTFVHIFSVYVFQIMNDTVAFGEEEQGTKFLKHPLTVGFHLLFRVLAVLTYIFSSAITNSYIICFLIVMFLLSMDFWTVKNISGRLLVGMRWWNVVDSEGISHWKFESRRDQTKIQPTEAYVFWWSLVLVPLTWALICLMDLVTFKMAYLMIAVLGLGMSGANLYGYIRCKWSSRRELSAYLSSTVFRTVNPFLMFKAATEQQPSTTQNI